MFEKIKEFFINLKNPLPKGYTPSRPVAYINPCCQVEVFYNTPTGRKSIFMQPFNAVMTAYLKEHGFDPESQIGKNPIIIFRMAEGSEICMPLYIDKKPPEGFSVKLTPEEAIKGGYIIPQMRKPNKN